MTEKTDDLHRYPSYQRNEIYSWKLVITLEASIRTSSRTITTLSKQCLIILVN